MTEQSSEEAKPEKRRPRKKRGQNASPKTIADRQRQQEALDLRVQGLGFQEIADRIGYSGPGSAFKAVQAVLGRAESESADELRALHAGRLLAAYQEVMPMLRAEVVLPELPGSWDSMNEKRQQDFLDAVVDRLASDQELKLKAADRLVRLMERESRLFGLDAPVRQDVSGEVTVVFDSALAPTPVDSVIVGEIEE